MATNHGRSVALETEAEVAVDVMSQLFLSQQPLGRDREVKSRNIISHNDLFVFESRGDLGEDFTIEFGKVGLILYHLAAASIRSSKNFTRL